MEGNLILHSAKFCRSFFDHLHETAKEFGNDFDEKTNCFSSLVVWTRDELKHFVEQFASQGNFQNFKTIFLYFFIIYK